MADTHACRYTPEYAAPEAHARGTAHAHMPSDVWSVGVTLMELLMGRLPQFAVRALRVRMREGGVRCWWVGGQGVWRSMHVWARKSELGRHGRLCAPAHITRP